MQVGIRFFLIHICIFAASLVAHFGKRESLEGGVYNLALSLIAICYFLDTVEHLEGSPFLFFFLILILKFVILPSY